MRFVFHRVAPLTVVVVVVALWAVALADGQANARSGPVAPPLLEPMDSSSQQYLIGVGSFALFAVAAILGVAALMRVDYSDDTLLMVEIPESMGDG